MKKVAIVTPIYKKNLSKSERFALQHGYKVLARYDKIFISPAGLEYKDNVVPDRVIHFDAEYFRNIAGYNRLMLSDFFYQQFQDYEYILIFQPDAFVFRDELEYWCGKNYAYIGAPWPGGYLLQPFEFLGTAYLAKYFPSVIKSRRVFVGNGGLSLRKVGAALEILDQHHFVAKFWAGNEDAFWSYYSSLGGRNFAVPSELEASQFSIELGAEHYLKLNQALPFGCHGWEKHNSDFWKKIFLKEIPEFRTIISE